MRKNRVGYLYEIFFKLFLFLFFNKGLYKNHQETLIVLLRLLFRMPTQQKCIRYSLIAILKRTMQMQLIIMSLTFF